MKRKILTAALSFLIAFGMWLYVITVVSPGYETTIRNVEVTCEGDDALATRKLMRDGKIDTTINLRLEGKRSDLVKLNRENVKVVVDVSNIFDANTHKLTYTVIYPGDVSQSEITVLSREPAEVYVKVVDRESAPVPVKEPILHGNPGPNNDGDYVERMDLAEYDTSIEVSGPKVLVDKIDHAKFSVDIQGKTQVVSGEYEYTLYDAEGNVLSKDGLTLPAKISATIPIHKVAEVPIKARVTEGGGATEENVRVFYYDENGQEKNTIWVSGEDNMIRHLEAIWLEDTVDLSRLTSGYTQTVPLKMPEGIYLVSDVQEVTVSVDFAGLVTKVFENVPITIENKPDGTTAALLSGSRVTVTLRGTPEQIGRIQESNLQVTVDLTNALVGKVSRTLSFAISGNFDKLGVVGEYPQVTIDVKAADN